MEPYITIAILFGFIGLGVLSKVFLQNIKLFNKLIHYLSWLIYYVILPLVFIDIFALRGLELADLNITLTAMTYVAMSVFALMKIPCGNNKKLRNAVIITSIFQNNVFLGFPVLLLLFNDISAAAMYSLVVFILHILVAGLLGVSHENILVSIGKIPIIYGFSIGVLIHYIVYNEYLLIAPYMNPLHSILSYGAVYILGYTLPLTLRYVRTSIRASYIVSIWRFLVSPIIHLILLAIFVLPELYWKEVMILSIMPPAVMNTVIARIYGWRPEFVASITFLLTLLSMIMIAIIFFTNILNTP
jgi:predicted permease